MIKALFYLLPFTFYLLSSCAVEKGNPWGEAQMKLWVQFEPDSESRLNEAGQLKTSSDYGIQINSLSLQMDTIALGVSSSGETLSFDPANPPEGYSLCHNGHCHADDGSLPTYEEIEAQLAIESSSNQISQAIDQEVALQAQQTSVGLGACSNECQLERGELRSVSVSASMMTLNVTIFDLSGTRSDWPQAGKSIELQLPLSFTLSQALSVKINRDRASGIEVEAEIQVSEKLFDGIDWSQDSFYGSNGEQSLSTEAQGELASLVLNNLEASEMRVSIKRYDL